MYGWSSTDGHGLVQLPIRWKASSWLSAARHTAGVPHSLYCALCQFEDGRPSCRLQWDVLSSCCHKESVRSIRISLEKPPPSRLRIKTAPRRANASLGCVAVIMQTFHSSCKANQEAPLYTNASTHLLHFVQIVCQALRAISWRLWSVVASSISGSFSCRSAHRDSAGTLPPRHKELVYTYLSFAAILANLIWAPPCSRTVLWIICSPSLKGLQVGKYPECAAFGWEKD